MAASTLDDDQLYRFARQLILSGFDEDHQIKLAATRVLLIGAGGLGAPALQYLVAAGIGHIAIVDDDDVDTTNLNRQVIHPEDHIGMAKVQSAEIAAKAMNKTVTITSHKTRFSEDNCTSLCQDIDLIIDASDNPVTRLLANDTAHRLKIPLVFGGAVRLEGQVASFRSGVDQDANCYRCVFPEAANQDIAHDLAPGCSEAGILGAITGIIGSIMALEAIKQALMPATPLGPGLNNKLLLFDGRYLSSQVITTEKRADCPCCGAR